MIRAGSVRHQRAEPETPFQGSMRDVGMLDSRPWDVDDPPPEDPPADLDPEIIDQIGCVSVLDDRPVLAQQGDGPGHDSPSQYHQTRHPLTQ